MPEQQSAQSTPDGKETSGSTSTAGDEQKQITLTSQQLAERLARAKPADYDNLKAKAAQFDQLQEASKSEADKAAERLAKLEERATKAEHDALRSRVQARHSISDEDADLFLTGTDEKTLTQQAERLSQRTSDRKKQGNYVPREGTNSTQQTGDDGMRDLARQLFNRSD